MAYAHNPLLAATASVLREKLDGMNLLDPVAEGEESSAFKAISDHVFATITEYGHSSPERSAALLSLLAAWLAFTKARGDDANDYVNEVNEINDDNKVNEVHEVNDDNNDDN